MVGGERMAFWCYVAQVSMLLSTANAGMVMMYDKPTVNFTVPGQ